MDSFEMAKCKKMADEIADIVALTPQLYAAFCEVPRLIFSPMARTAFSLDPQPIASNQWISSPLTVAQMTLALEAENCDNVLEIGLGSGYQAAILAKLAHRIFSVERIEKLAQSARERIKTLGIKNINIRHDDGNAGWPTFAPFERILLSCAAPAVPPRLFSQLKDGGILVAPVENGGGQIITKFIKNGENIREIRLNECEFVPLKSGVEREN